MLMPNVVHPKNIKFNGFTYQIVAYCKMTDDQALKALIHFLQNRKNRPKKADQKNLIKVLIALDEDSLGLL